MTITVMRSSNHTLPLSGLFELLYSHFWSQSRKYFCLPFWQLVWRIYLRAWLFCRLREVWQWQTLSSGSQPWCSLLPPISLKRATRKTLVRKRITTRWSLKRRRWRFPTSWTVLVPVRCTNSSWSGVMSLDRLTWIRFIALEIGRCVLFLLCLLQSHCKINHVMSTLASKRGPMRVYQLLPRHLRRRTMSHNSYVVASKALRNRVCLRMKN